MGTFERATIKTVLKIRELDGKLSFDLFCASYGKIYIYIDLESDGEVVIKEITNAGKSHPSPKSPEVQNEIHIN